ncbi:MAG: hypothetical protein ACRDTG_25550 [Pseudonocardiaceae bacterium]
MDQRAACEKEIVELNEQEGADAFDAVARREMGISGAEFLRRWDTGVYAGRRMDDIKGLVATWMVMDLVR